MAIVECALVYISNELRLNNYLNVPGRLLYY